MKFYINETYKNILLHSFKISFSILIIWWLVHTKKLDISYLYDNNTNQFKYSVWYLIIIIRPISVLLLSYRWQKLCEVKNIYIKFKESFRINILGQYFTLFLPGFIGLDIVRGYNLTRNKSKPLDIISISILDKFIGLYSLLNCLTIQKFLIEIFFTFFPIVLKTYFFTSLEIIFSKFFFTKDFGN